VTQGWSKYLPCIAEADGFQLDRSVLEGICIAAHTGIGCPRLCPSSRIPSCKEGRSQPLTCRFLGCSGSADKVWEPRIQVDSSGLQGTVQGRLWLGRTSSRPGTRSTLLSGVLQHCTCRGHSGTLLLRWFLMDSRSRWGKGMHHLILCLWALGYWHLCHKCNRLRSLLLLGLPDSIFLRDKIDS